MTRHTILTRSGGTVGIRSAAELGVATVDQPATAMPYVVGMFAPFDQWTEVASAAEGRFLEQVAPGAFAASIARDRSSVRVLFDHGQDPFIGSRPIARLDGLREDGRGAWFFGQLFDTVAARELLPLLEAKVLGSSFRFRADRERVNDWPTRSERNPERLAERTILQATLIEIGPCVFPVYKGATAGASSAAHPPRSSTPAMSRDEFLRRLAKPPSDTPAARAARKRWLDRMFGKVAA